MKLLATISNNLLATVAFAFALGIALAHSFSLTSGALAIFTAALLVLALLLLTLHLSRRRNASLWLLPPLFVAAGCWYGQLHLAPPPADSLYRQIETKSETLLVGTLAAMVEFDGTFSRLRLNCEQYQRRDDPALLFCREKVLLRLPGSWPERFRPGERLAIRAELRRPEGYRSPGSFDLAAHYARQGITVTGFIRSPLFIAHLDPPPGWWQRVRFFPEQLRSEIGRAIDRTLSDPERSAMYRAILLGDRSRLSPAVLEDFKASGTFHILAISGLHIGILSVLLFTLFYQLLCRSEWLLLRWPARKLAAFCTLPVLLVYALLAGLNTPVARAVLMASLVLLAICLDRQRSPAAILAFAALTILLADPLQLATTSFQLSFTAVAALLFLLPQLQRLLSPSKPPNQSMPLLSRASTWLLAALLVSLVATLATAPIAIHAFHRFSLVGPLANLLVEPLLCLWSLPAGFFALPLLSLQPEAAALLLRFGAHGLDAALAAAAFFAALPFADIRLPPPPLWLIAGYYVALLLLTGRTGPGLLLPALACLLALLLLHPLYSQEKSHRTGLQLSYLDVGQGSAGLVELPSGYRLLIDGGTAGTGSGDIGERVIAPYLWQRGIQRLDAVALTHPDADHCNGLSFILRHFSPTVLWLREAGDDSACRELLRVAAKRGVATVVPADGQRLGDASGYVENVANSWRLPGVGNGRRGNSGLVLKVCIEEGCALFPGDIEKGDEQSLVGRGYDLAATILLAPHHGSNTSSSPAFFAAVQPDYLVVSAGRGREGWFPGSTLLNRSGELALPLWTTARHGTIEAVLGREGLEVYGHQKAAANPLAPLVRTLLHRGPLPAGGTTAGDGEPGG